MSNRLVESFLEDPTMDNLYKDYLINPSESKKLYIEQHFKRHVKKIKILSYFSKVLIFEAQNFDRKIRNISNTYPLILEESNSFDFTTSLISHDSFDALIKNAEQLEVIIEDRSLFNIISKLNSRNKQLLYLLYVKEMDESDIANYFGVTKQAINKRKKNILNKIRVKYIQEKGENG